MKVSSLSFALIMALTGGFGAVLQPYNMTGADLELHNMAKDDYEVPRGWCSVSRGFLFSRKWEVTLTNVSNDPVKEICDRLWAGLARRKCLPLQLTSLTTNISGLLPVYQSSFQARPHPSCGLGHLHFFNRISSLVPGS